MKVARQLHRWLTGAEGDVPEAEPRNALLHLTAGLGSKIGDELANPRLILAWLLQALGSPLWMVGWLVPIRDAGALVPQIALAGRVRALRSRKWAWVTGALLQGAGAAAMAALAFWGSGPSAGALVLGALAVGSIARAASSIASKDVLGRTVAKRRRGAVTGWSGSIASGVALAAGAAMTTLGDRPAGPTLAVVLAAAGLSWAFCAFAAAAIDEPAANPGDVGQDHGFVATAREGLGLLRAQPAFRRYLLARLLALASAMAMPFVALGAADADAPAALDRLGILVIVSALAGVIAKPIWGRWADRSSPAVLATGCAMAALACGAAALWADRTGAVAIALYGGLALAHAGIRVGRKTYVIDLADDDTRAVMVAVGNTIVGIALLVTGSAVGFAVHQLGRAPVLGILACCAAGAAVSAATLRRP